ncbi:hypothetical protein C8F01DRAFT_1370957 [Mycena amicta]|nr:hypothetical protein C8F01DRAFT_1370957 [Mycena amicta]
MVVTRFLADATFVLVSKRPTLQTTHLRSHLPHLPSELASLLLTSSAKSSLPSFRARLADLAHTRKEISDQLRTITYPILTIPPELTTLIFTHLADLIADEDEFTSPFVLTHVCRAWRRIAVASPRIWSHIYMDTSATESIRIPEYLRLCFERAGNAPLAVHTPYGARPELFALLSNHSERFDSLECDLPFPENCSLDGIAGRLPNLRKLELSSVSNTLGPVTIFSEAPALREVRIYYNLSSTSADIQLPWMQLTSVQFSNHIPAILQMLEGMPNLEILGIPPAEYATPTATIHLDRLHTLRITHNGSPTFRFLTFLRCPALEVLEVNLHNGPNAEHRGFLSSFISGPNRLRSLTLSNLAGWEAAVLLSHVPTSISELDIRSLKAQHTLFDRISSKPPSLPNLTRLTVSGLPVELPYESILPALEALAKATPNLRQFNGHIATEPWDAGKEGKSPGLFAQKLREVTARLNYAVDIEGPWMQHYPSTRGILYSLEDADVNV